jgi:hypothetical protein
VCLHLVNDSGKEIVSKRLVSVAAQRAACGVKRLCSQVQGHVGGQLLGGHRLPIVDRAPLCGKITPHLLDAMLLCYERRPADASHALPLGATESHTSTRNAPTARATGFRHCDLGL